MSAEIEYKGETIYFREDAELWVWRADGFSHAKLQRVKDRIDKSLKVEFEATEAWVDTGGQWFKVRVTSQAEGLDYHREHEYWTTGPHGRAKRSARYLMAVVPDNEQIIERIQALRQQIKVMEEQVRESEQELVPFEQWLVSKSAER